MPKEFNYMQRVSELLLSGVPDDEAIEILNAEEAEADFTVLDDGAWFSMLDRMRAEAEAEVEAELAAEVR